ncbi:MAG: fumarylacetoacetate hydrolase family protein, partial [Terriglobales bacterium]
MRLLTFEDSSKRSRIGALVDGDRVVDLNAAYALHLRDAEGDKDFARKAATLVPSNMRALLEGGDPSLEAARRGLEHALSLQSDVMGPDGEKVVHARVDVRWRAPIIPRKFFHTAGNFREHHEEAQKAGFSHPVMPWIVFFQNVDAIIGPDEPVIYPRRLTEELDYELELAVVLK